MEGAPEERKHLEELISDHFFLLLEAIQYLGSQLHPLIVLLEKKGIITDEELEQASKELEVMVAIKEAMDPAVAAAMDEGRRIKEERRRRAQQGG